MSIGPVLGAGVVQTDLPVPTVLYVVQSGTRWVDHNWTTVNLTEPFTDPIVVVGPPTSYGLAPGVIRVRNVTPDSFQMKFQEWDYLDGSHCAELVFWTAIERGNYTGGSGEKIIAEKFSTNKTNVFAPRWVAFPEVLSEPPVVVAQVMTCNGAEAVTDRICGVYPGGMHFSMQEQEASGGHCYEEVGYLAFSREFYMPVGLTPNVVTHKPYMLVDIGRQTVLHLREEQSADAETVHWTPEKVGYLSAPYQPPFIADLQTCHGADPCSLRCTLLAQHWLSATGVASVTHDWQTVPVPATFMDPVVIAGPATYNGTDPGEIRVRSVTPTSFQIRFQEWDYLDGWHGAEQVRWFVIERGGWDYGGGVLCMVNEFPISNANVFSPAWVRPPLTLTSGPPRVYATQQTANGPSAVTERISNVGLTGFNVALQEEEAADAMHAEETLGYCMWGLGTGGVSAPRAGQQLSVATIGVPGASAAEPRNGWETLIVEEQSLDAETWHCAETINVMSVGAPPGELNFVADMQTCDGTDPCSLRCHYLGATAGKPGAPALQALGQAGSGICVLSVAARTEGGASLEAADIGVNGSAAGALPVVCACALGETMTLSAPLSISGGAEALAFSQWEVDGVSCPLSQATIQVKMTASREAVAVYGPLP